jgi:sigma-B regulation protein RsbU (phosphoserine phosphatase)
MRDFKVRLSLRYKLLFLLTTLPIVSLALYLFMATDLFQKDKVAYVFDSSATVSRSLATQTRIELQSSYSALRSIIEHYDFNIRQFNAVGVDLFQKNSKAHALLLFRRQDNGSYAKMGELVKDEPVAKSFATDSATLIRLRDLAVRNTGFVMAYPAQAGAASMAFRLGEASEPEHMIVMALYQADDMVNAFDSTGLYVNMLISRSGVLAFGQDASDQESALLDRVLKSKASEGTAEAVGADKQVYLVSYASVGLGNLVVVSQVNKQKALKAVEVLVAKSMLFFVSLIALTLLISVFASSRLTSTLRELFEATGKVAKGDFSVRVRARSNDEVGGLAESFNLMAGEVSRLMSETAEKARMQSELDTVKTVQEALFPEAKMEFGPIGIMGHFEPASECGGDWWSYSRVGDKIYLWIGDATGHGTPAALITSAARSAAAVIESLPDMTPGRALTIMNRAINMTSKGQIMMTFFMASIDLLRGTFTYASASHDPPYLLKRSGHKLSRKDLIPLNEVNGPRLGDQKDFQYQDITVDFAPGDLVFLYTDGILDVENPEGKKWGERAFLKALLDSANTGVNAESKIEKLRMDLNQFRSGASLADDVTMVMCEYQRQEAA